MPDPNTTDTAAPAMERPADLPQAAQDAGRVELGGGYYAVPWPLGSNWALCAPNEPGERDLPIGFVHPDDLRDMASALSRPEPGGTVPTWRPMSEEPIGRPITARKKLDDGSWWYARVRAWRYEDGDGGRFGDHGYELLHYNGDVMMDRFYGPFDGWCKIDADVAEAPPAPAPTATLAEVEEHFNRYHFVDETPFQVDVAEGKVVLGRGWLAITESEYVALRRGDGDAVPAELVALSDAAKAVRDAYLCDEFSFKGPRLMAKLSHAIEVVDRAEVETISSIAQWCEKTFGPITPERIASRAAEEMEELRAEPSKVEEAADVVICLARYPGLWDAVQRKMAVNRARKWRLMGDGTGYHIKTEASARAGAESGEGA